MRKTWRERWMLMAEGKISEYETIKGMDVFEFYALYDIWAEKVQQRNQRLKNELRNGKL